MQTKHHRFVIVGGGTAGTVVAKRLRLAGQSDIALIEPSSKHFYQPLFTLVGGGAVARESTVRDEASYIPNGVSWVKDWVAEIAPDQQYVETRSGVRIGYDFLVIAAGLQLNFDAIPGLKEAVGKDGVSTNYTYQLAPKTWELIKGFKGGTALFHMPGCTPIKCPGAPQKIMYLAADHFRRNKISANVIYGCGVGGIYGVKEYAAILNKVVARYGIDARYNHELVEIRPDRKEAIFQIKGQPDDTRVTIPYDIFHVVPPQSAPDFIANSPLADKSKPGGWVKVDKFTLQHPDYPNVFALGDVGNTPNAKTGAAALRQAPALVENLLTVARGKEPAAEYNGYVACPIVTGYGRMLLCEFDYRGKPTPTITFLNTMKERYDMWLLKKYGLPWLYWHVMLRGRTVPFVHRPELAVLETAPEAAA